MHSVKYACCFMTSQTVWNEYINSFDERESSFLLISQQKQLCSNIKK